MKKILFITLLFVACKNDTAVESTPQIVEIPEEFVSFYEKFHTDSLFQLEHIIFPLSMKSDSTKWQKDEWTHHKAFDSQDGAYTREFDNFNGIIIETIREKNNSFKIERRFSKSSDSYNLIYYVIENQLEMWGEKELTIDD